MYASVKKGCSFFVKLCPSLSLKPREQREQKSKRGAKRRILVILTTY